MSVLAKLKKDKVDAMKNKATALVTTYTFVLAEAQNKAKADSDRDITDADVIQAAKAIIKKNQDVLDKIGLDTAYSAELIYQNKVLKDFLPQQLTEDQIRGSLKLMWADGITKGELIKSFKSALAKDGRYADMKLVAQIADEVLEDVY